MNIRDALLEVHSKAQAEKICGYVGDDPERFAELMKLMMGPIYRLSQRAAWPVSYCVERHPDLITPYWGKLAEQLEREDAHVAVRRNVARLLQFVEIPKRYQGRIFDACFELFADVTQSVAVRCFSLSVAANLAKDKPELIQELRLVAAQHPETATAGMRARFKNVLGL
ncbi:MAG: hypothetical protein ABL999_05400 [Pyrinomonadaceae bacterium]